MRPSAASARDVVDFTVPRLIPMAWGDLRFGKLEVKAQHERFALAGGQTLQPGQHLAVLLREEHRRLGRLGIFPARRLPPAIGLASAPPIAKP
jgi:hypothetical protein